MVTEDVGGNDSTRRLRSVRQGTDDRDHHAQHTTNDVPTERDTTSSDDASGDEVSYDDDAVPYGDDDVPH